MDKIRSFKRNIINALGKYYEKILIEWERLKNDINNEKGEKDKDFDDCLQNILDINLNFFLLKEI